MAESLSERASEGLSAGARRRWVEQVRALDEAGLASPARLELVGSWAHALDSRDHAVAVWQEAGRPESEAGSQGQPRRSHLAVAVEKAEAVLAGLTGKLERSVARREPKRTGGLPPGARRVEIDGVPMVLSEDGRLLARSVKDGRWMLFADERDFDAGAMLRWLDPDDQLPRFADPPPHVFRDGESRVPDRDEVVEWARLRGVPEAAALAWLDQERRWSRFVLRDDVDVARFGLDQTQR